MKVDLLERGTLQSAALGWLASRSMAEAAAPEVIARIDASVNELPTMLVLLRDVMVLERELFVTPRNHVIWARTSRVDDVSKFTTPREFYSVAHDKIRMSMELAKDQGVPQDQWRMMMPLCALTSFVARISFRDAIRQAKHFDRVAGIVASSNQPLSAYLQESAKRLLITAAKAFDLPEASVMDIFHKYSMPPLNILNGEEPNRVHYGEFIGVQIAMPVALRAQIARHRDLLFTDNFIELLAAPGSEQLPVSTAMTMNLMATNDTWRHVLTNRACWMAQQDLWSTVVDAVGFSTMLPCAGGHCPYGEDAEQRLAGRDPGAPCPRYSNLTGKRMNTQQVEAAEVTASRMQNFHRREQWKDELRKQFVTCERCPTPVICTVESYCDHRPNGYR